jgi:hypothetical protein
LRSAVTIDPIAESSAQSSFFAPGRGVARPTQASVNSARPQQIEDKVIDELFAGAIPNSADTTAASLVNVPVGAESIAQASDRSARGAEDAITTEFRERDLFGEESAITTQLTPSGAEPRPSNPYSKDSGITTQRSSAIPAQPVRTAGTFSESSAAAVQLSTSFAPAPYRSTAPPAPSLKSPSLPAHGHVESRRRLPPLAIAVALLVLVLAVIAVFAFAHR